MNSRLSRSSRQSFVSPMAPTHAMDEVAEYARMVRFADVSRVEPEECSPDDPLSYAEELNKSDAFVTVAAIKQEPEKAVPQPDSSVEKPSLTPKQFKMIIFVLSTAALLSALTETIAIPANPVIAQDFVSSSDERWIPLSFLLTSTFFQPFFGRATDLYGSRTMLYVAFATFNIGSLFCGVSTNFIWFCCARAITGIGAAGLIAVVMVVISQIVPLRDRGIYFGLIFARTFMPTVLGPFLGAFLANSHWRWCFYINLILSAPAVGVLILQANGMPNTKKPDVSLKDVDFGGIFLLSTFVICLSLALFWGGTAYPWNSLLIMVLLAVGCTSLPVFVIWEMFVPHFPVIPVEMFLMRNVASCAGCYFFTSMSTSAFSTYIPSSYLLARGYPASPFPGLALSIYVILSVKTAGGVGLLLARTGRTRPWLWLGSTVTVLGNGLAVLLNGHCSAAAEYVALTIAGVGAGFLQANTVSAQRRVPADLLASVAAMTQWSRSLGALVGGAVEGAIVHNTFSSAIAASPDAAPYADQLFAEFLAGANLTSVPRAVLADAAAAYAEGFSAMMVAVTVLCVVGMLCAFAAQETDLGPKTGEDTEAAPAKAGAVAVQTEKDTHV